MTETPENWFYSDLRGVSKMVNMVRRLPAPRNTARMTHWLAMVEMVTLNLTGMATVLPLYKVLQYGTTIMEPIHGSLEESFYQSW